MKFFTLTSFFLFCLSSGVTKAQTPNWQWAQSIGDNYNVGYNLTTDNRGYVYALGGFRDAIITLGGSTLTNTGNTNTQNIYIVKYDSLGNVLWAVNGGGDSSSYYYAAGVAYVSNIFGDGICADANGNIYMSGRFNAPSITFGGTTLFKTGGVTEFNSFIVKFDSTGNIMWLTNMGGAEAPALSCDGNGNIYVAGFFEDSAITLGNIVLNNAGVFGRGAPIFIAKYDPSGMAVWAKEAGGIDRDDARAITTSPNGNIYVTGSFSSSFIAFDSDSIENSDIHGSSSDIFTAAFDPSGAVIWLKDVGGVNNAATGITADADDNVYITGTVFSNQIVFGNTVLQNGSDANIFIAKYNSTGDVVWAKNVNGTIDYYGAQASTDARGNVYIAGPFGSPDIFSFRTAQLAATIFVAKYDPVGDLIWEKNTVGGASVGGLSSDANGNVYVTGAFSNPGIEFEPNITLITSTESAFVARISKDSVINIVDSHLSMFPNPTTGVLYFKGTELGNQLEIFNMLGQVVYSAITTADNCYINIGGKPSGTYAYRITNKNTVVAKGKFILLTQPTPVFEEYSDN